MAYDKDQEDFSLPVPGSDNGSSSSNFLPKFFRTDINKKFIDATIDQMIKPGVVEKLSGFAGRRYAKAATVNDNYITDVTQSREDYQFEPVSIYKDELGNVEFLKDYNDLIGQVSSLKGPVLNHSLFNKQEYYAWDSHIDWDKFVNFREYYWLPTGPLPIGVFGQARDVVSTYSVTIADDVDNYAYVFSPNGFTKNPRVKLFKGQTYRFEINALGHPMAFVISRLIEDRDLGTGVDLNVTDILYTKGIKRYVYDADNKLVETNDAYIEEGVIEFTIPDDVPNILYYVSKNDVNTSGIATFAAIEENTDIDVESEILGKKTYKTGAGIELSNGMKVFFQGLVTPAIYDQGYWYVEGVGNSIKLIKEQNLEIPSVFTSEINIPFDNYGFDQYPFEDATAYAGTKDYIVINRSSADRNPWSRYNRWFHVDVIKTSAESNGQEMNLDQDFRAKRPIIEFEAGLKLWNHGSKAKDNVNLVDDYTKDVFSTIEGSIGYNIDGVDVTDGMRILFTADTDTLINGKTYQVKFITHNGRRQISLVEINDTVPLTEQTVLVTQGNTYKGKMFWYNGTEWKSAQDKTLLNQSPLFDLFDKNEVSLNDTTFYPASDFRGNKLFSYRVGTGTVDTELGFSLTYRNIANVGDIVFDFNLLKDTITYQQDLSSSLITTSDTAFLKRYNSYGDNFTWVNGWKKAKTKSTQPVIRQYNISAITNNFAIDVFNNSGTLTDLVVRVFVNGKKVTNYTIQNINNFATVVFDKSLLVDDILVLKCFSSASKNANGFYEIPIGLERNPLNENLTTLTLGEINDHVGTIVEDHPDFVGTYLGSNNLRDLGNTTEYGKRFVQHSGPTNLSTYHLTDKDSNVYKAIKYAKKEYSKFKRRFIDEASNSGYHGPVKQHVDLILQTLIKNNLNAASFYFSDMLGVSAAIRTEHSVDYAGPSYFTLSAAFDLTTISSKAVNVYRNGEQLVYNKDYIIETNFVNVTINLEVGDIIEVYEYESTVGSYIPPTPTKLGLYPKFHPMMISDNSYSTTSTMIQGHDGSLTLAFDDYRDDLILELEKRIYNNIKVDYDVNLIDIHDLVGTVDRNTGFSDIDINKVLLSDYKEWEELAGSPNLSDISFWNQTDSFTFNYSNMKDNQNRKLKGFWRNIYKQYYDTDRPHTHPWEMLGFAIQPTWWEDVYGPAPYTKDNLILWQDLSEGVIREPNTLVSRNKKYVRPDLLSYIPVNEYGQLISPLDSGLAQDFNIILTKQNFAFGDHSPVETAWRRSSDYPFSLITAWTMLQPNHILGLGFDRSRTKRDKVGNVVYDTTQKRISLSNLVFPSVSKDETPVLTAGLVNYITNYVAMNSAEKYNTYKIRLANIKNQLVVKLGGFADKTKLKLVLDSRSPLNKSSVFVPDENYSIVINTSSPLLTATFSGIIIEKTTGGYIINGYDKSTPEFAYTPVREIASDPAFTVGGISETFVSWSSDQLYPNGTVVEYNSVYYRSKLTHTSSTQFDQNKFVKLASLPIVGGVSAYYRKSFLQEVQYLPYGSLLTSVQDVVDFMFGYENYLKSIGFKFNFVNADNILENMLLCAKEFMFFVTQNWDNGTVLSVSPAANSLEFEKAFYNVDNIFNNFYDYNILTGSGSTLINEFTSTYRKNANQFNIRPKNTDDGIFLVKLPLVQTEHVILIDNETAFADVIFDTIPGYRQERIKLVGYRTDEWNGGLNIPGFIYNDVKITQWNTYTDYTIGNIVKYKEFYYIANKSYTSDQYFDANYWTLLLDKPESELLPNWDYRVNQFTDFYDLDTDNFDTEQQRLGQHLIGYQPREYLANIITDSVSQYKFYQGFIQDKGTKNVLTKLFDALSSANKDSLEFYEEWALRLGQYGAIDNLVEVEYKLNESKYKLEPQIVELVNQLNSSRVDLVYEIAPYQVYNKPVDYTHQPFTVTNDTTVYSKDSGYVRESDIKRIITSREDLPSIDIDQLLIGDFVWVTNDDQTWSVIRHINTPFSVVSAVIGLPIGSNLDVYNNAIVNGFTIYTDSYTDITVGEYVGLKIRSIPELNGFWKVVSSSLNEIGLESPEELNFDIDLITDSSVIGLTRFAERRFADIEDVNSNIQNLLTDVNDTIWIDDNGTNNWTVLKNERIFELNQEIINPNTTTDGFATTFDTNNSNTILVTSRPAARENNDPEEVFVYSRYSDSVEYELKQTITKSDLIGKIIFDADTALDGTSSDITIQNHGLVNGEVVVYFDKNNGVIGDLEKNKSYYVQVVGQDTIQLSTDFAGLNIVDLSGSYTGDHQLVSTTHIFGYDVSLSEDGKYLAVGVPYASNLNTLYKGVLDLVEPYTIGDIVLDRGILWEAIVNVNGDSTISDLSQDWRPIHLIETTASGTYSGLTSQGAVCLYEKDVNGTYRLLHTISSPDPSSYEYFGTKVEIRKNANGVYKLFVGAPGEVGTDPGRIYFLDTSSGNWSYSKDRAYKGTYSSLQRYYVDDVVLNDNKQWLALQPTSFLSPITPGTNSLVWELISDVDNNFNTNMVEHTGYIPHVTEVIGEDAEAGIYTNVVNVGTNFDVNKLGDVLVVSSDFTSEGRKITIYKNIVDRWKFTQLIESDSTVNEFGKFISVDLNGDMIAISSPTNDEYKLNAGIVDIYQNTYTGSSYQFVKSQTLKSPKGEQNEMFGNGISFYNNKLAIGSKNTDKKSFTTFDRFVDPLLTTSGNYAISKYTTDTASTENIGTTFDAGVTRFSTVKKDAGRIILFQNIANQFLYAEDLNYNRDTRLQNISNFKLVDNHLYIGLPTINPKTTLDSTLWTPYSLSDDSSVGMLVDLLANKNKDSWSNLTQQVGKVNLNKIKRAFLYSLKDDDILTTVDIIDPRQGKIAGPAEQELSFKTFYDPAIYSASVADTNGNIVETVLVDPENNWTEKYVGKLWWNLSTASWYNPYQGNTQYRTWAWNKILPTASIDVYEWVGTTLTPTQWSAQADTSAGFTKGISGQPLYGNNVYSVKRVYDTVAQTYIQKYFFWVKDKKVIPQADNRLISAFDVARLIESPNTIGYRFVAPLEADSFALYNVKSFIEGTNTVLHFTTTLDEELETNIHSEYQLITEGLETSFLNSNIEQKWIDSLVGYDLNNRSVPDKDLPVKQRYGILNYPRQSMFINRTEAVKQFVERVNAIFKENQIVDNYSLESMLLAQPVPSTNLGKYDVAVDTLVDLDYVSVAKVETATFTPIIEKTKIVGVTIVNPGRGYKYAPSITISDSKGYNAVIKTTINNLGQVTGVLIRNQGRNYTENTTLKVRDFSVFVNSDSAIGGRWSIFAYNRVTKEWIRTENQNYDTTKYWNYIDWYATGYTESILIDYIVDQSYELFALNDSIGDIVKINTIGTGGWLLLKKVNNLLTEDYTVNYETVGRQNGTIELSTKLYDFITTTSGYDAAIYDNAFYDREPVIELRNILSALKNDIFISDLTVEYNNTFFASLRYVFYEQQTVDWAFKTSFVRAKHNLGGLIQKITYQNDNLENYQDYVNEVKPYKTTVREYISSYEQIEPTVSLTTDFDLPPSYDPYSLKIETSIAKYKSGVVTDVISRYAEYPYKSWVDNNQYDVVEIRIADGGSGYTQTPIVTVSGDNGTTAKAYLSRGVVSSIEIVNKGGKYLSVPTITIEGSLAEGGTPAKAVAILGNGVVRKAHLTIKFDRVSGSYYITDINKTETFTGTGGKVTFMLTYPIDLKTNTYTVEVDGVKQLTSNFVIGNDLDTSKGYDRYLGYVDFIEPPAVNAVITIAYKKNVSMLTAADRINFFYSPTTGMLGSELSQLMDGVTYTGATYNSIGFGTKQGFDLGGFGSLAWDTFDNTYEDEVFVLDGSTYIFEMSKVLEDGVEYNIYLNGIRIDDLEWDGTTVLNNKNAVMLTVIGDGSTTTITLPNTVDPVANDVLVIRKSTSDGSFTPTNESYDTALSGGNLQYTTATGIASEDITVDGDDFVTQTTGKGPEELVPGQVLDALDIKVYHKATDGVGIINTVSYRLDQGVTSFKLPGIPQSYDGIIVKIDNNVLDTRVWSVNWNLMTLEFEDSASVYTGLLTITTIGTNGIDLLDNETAFFDGSTVEILTKITYNANLSTFITVNGIVKQEGIDYSLSESTIDDEYPLRLKIVFEDNVLTEGDFIQYTIYNSRIQQYSQVMIDKTFIADGENDYFEFNSDSTTTPIPFNDKPISHRILVKVSNRILSPGYSKTYTATIDRVYDIETWQFDEPLTILKSEVLVYVDNLPLARDLYSFDPVNGRIQILRNDIAVAGQKIDIFVLRNADYYFVDTKIVLSALDSSSINLTAITQVGETVTLVSAGSTVYTAEVIAVETDSITVRKYRRDIYNSFIINDEFDISFNDNDSTQLKVTDLEFVPSDSLSFVTAPAAGVAVEIYTFSNHDVNDFSRSIYDIKKTTYIPLFTDEYLKRNMINRGLFPISTRIKNSNYVWVSVNGILLTPEVDYTILSDQQVLRLNIIPTDNDRIDILEFGNAPVSPKYGFRIFKDILNRTHYKRLNQNNSYTLANPLNYYDVAIYLDDSTGIFLPDRNKNIPGVIFLDNERIEYFEVRGNTLLQLRRGTLGTGVKNLYSSGTRAFGAGPEETIDYADRTYRQVFVADGTSNEYTLDFTPNSLNEIEVFVGGRRLRKNSVAVFNPNTALDSTEGDLTISGEFRVSGVNLFIEIRDPLTNLIIDPSIYEDQQIKVVRKVGRVWNESNKTLADSDNSISRFLRRATIELPK